MASSSAEEAPPMEEDNEALLEVQETESRSGLRFCPLVLQRALPRGTGKIEGQARTGLQLIRLSWMAILAVVYAVVLYDLVESPEVTSGVRQEIVDELFPDGGKASERLKEGEVTAGAKEFVHSDDVAQTLTWFTTFCRMKAATDDHIMDAWSCTLNDIAIGQTSVSRWDASTNRGLPDDGTDSTKALRQRRVYNFSVSQEDAQVSEDRYKAAQQICSQRFLNDHMVIGDDPISERAGGSPEPSAGFKDPEQFAENYIDSILKEFSVAGEFEELGGDPEVGLDQIVETLDDIKSSVKERHDNTTVQKENNESSEETAVLQEVNRSEDVGAVESDREGATAKIPEAAPSSLLARSVTKRRSRQRRTTSCSVLGADGDDDDEEDPVETYSPQCFDRTDIGGIVRQAWRTADRDGDLKIAFDEQGAKRLARFLAKEDEQDAMVAKLKSHDRDKDGEFSVYEYFEFIRKNMDSLSVPGRGYLATKCRNHHFGLLSLCKPTHITVTYTTLRVERGKAGEYRGFESLVTRLHFTAAGGNQKAGWYRLQYQISAYSAWGDKGLWQLMLMSATLLLMMFALVLDFLLTILFLPVSLLRLLCLRIPRGTSLEDANKKVASRINVLFDWRMCRSRYLTFSQLVVENAIAAAFVLSLYQAVKEAFTPSFTSSGAHSPTCMKALLDMDLEWMKASLAGTVTKRGLTPFEYLLQCRNDMDTIPKYAELVNVLFFESNGKVSGFVLALMFLRVSQILEFWQSMKWLPNTLALARPKVIEFTVAYGLLISAFSVVIHIQFGDLYAQYSSLPLSFIALLMYSFGDTDRATDGMYPFLESSGTAINMYLLAYTLIVVTICLNVFTTIVIDAYTAATDPDEVVKVLEERDCNSKVWLLHRFAEDPSEYPYVVEKRRGSLFGT
eukprot:TRINITY_DN8606_c0_g4_i1.p1 TRINITY_DN8606_c0_g4~~TRINITY_DN8606_c0_g4_i1.p1  ORF type:complete len:904 (+),score=113.97 TRINITY_DN8606_c0_g4_i1:67-2778(+)